MTDHATDPARHRRHGDHAAVDRTPGPRRIVVLVLAFAAVLASQFQTLTGVGLTPSEFSADGDETLRAAGYAFSIWGLIYLGMIVYGVWQAWPSTPQTAVIRRFGWPSAVAFFCVGAWVIASALNAKWVTVALIVVALGALLSQLIDGWREVRAAGRKDRALVLWPLGALAGWLTVATALNILTVATADGLVGDAPLLWSVLAVLAVAAVGVLVTWRTRLVAYPAPIVWGLVAVFVAEQPDNPVAAFLALAAAFALALATAWIVFRARHDPARPDAA